MCVISAQSSQGGVGKHTMDIGTSAFAFTGTNTQTMAAAFVRAHTDEITAFGQFNSIAETSNSLFPYVVPGFRGKLPRLCE